jgi:hypothetical protein
MGNTWVTYWYTGGGGTGEGEGVYSLELDTARVGSSCPRLIRRQHKCSVEDSPV